MDVVLVLVAVAVAGILLAHVMSSPAPEAAGPMALMTLPTSVAITGVPPLVGTVAARLPLHVYTAAPTQVHPGRAGPPAAGAEYTLALARQPGGRWASVLHVPAAASEGGTLTVTLVVPWGELVGRYSAVNLVVR